MDGHGTSTPILSWGRQLPTVKVDAKKEEKRNFKRYASFFLEGVEYRPRDTVYLNASDGPPYIATILSLLEDLETSENVMRVRWFLRTCELRKGLADVDYRDLNKEIFMQWGIASNNLVDPASTIRKCSVLCTAQENWNTARPTSQQIVASDHVFKRAYDATRGKLESLEVIIQSYGLEYVTQVGKPIVLATRTETAKGDEDGPTFGFSYDGATGGGSDAVRTANPFPRAQRRKKRGRSHSPQIPVPEVGSQSSGMERKGFPCWNAGSRHASQLPFPEVDLNSGRDSTASHFHNIRSQHASQRPVPKGEFHNSQRDGKGTQGAEKGECSRPLQGQLRRRSTSVIRHYYRS